MFKDIDIRIAGKLCELISNKNTYQIMREQRAYDYLDKFIVLNQGEASDVCKNRITEKKVNFPIWVCWLQGIDNAPEIVKVCIHSIKKYISGGEMTIITLDNLSEYIDLPDFIIKKYKEGIISSTHLSDIIRVTLLSVYGGCWIDATVYVMGKIPDAWYKKGFFMFDISDKANEFKLLGSWWIACEPGNKLIREIRDCLFKYWSQENVLCDYFLFHKLLTKLIRTDENNYAIYANKSYFETGHTHVLRKYFKCNYDSSTWNEITRLCPVQKLSWKVNYTRVKGSFYDYIVKEYEHDELC